jgi:iron complex outermembrane recepter protein
VLAQNDTGAQTDAGAITLPTVEVTANPQATPGSGYGGAGPAQDPYNTSYTISG